MITFVDTFSYSQKYQRNSVYPDVPRRVHSINDLKYRSKYRKSYGSNKIIYRLRKVMLRIMHIRAKNAEKRKFMQLIAKT